MATVQLVVPDFPYLDAYRAALRAGWASHARGAESAAMELARLEADPAAFLAGETDPDGRAPGFLLPDGSRAPSLPGFRLWLWDGGFAGSIGLRWMPDGAPLPADINGHIGYGVVPWKRGRGYARLALSRMLDLARERGLAEVQLSVAPDNVASRRVIEACGGRLAGAFVNSPVHGSCLRLRYRVELAQAACAVLAG